MRLLVTFALLAATASAKCIPFTDAPQHVGATKCVSGKVVKVNRSDSGNFYLNFCDDYRSCAFAVVVFPGNLKDVGDVRWLEGREIEIHGQVRDYGGQSEIILRDVRQLRGEAAKVPPLPRGFDVELRGNHSAGQFKSPKSKQNPRKRRRNQRTRQSEPAEPQE